MSPALRVPKVQIQAEVTVDRRPPVSYKMFLSERIPNTRCERPSEMLNGSRTFLPVVDGAGSIVFLPIGVIVMVSIPADWEFDESPAVVPPDAELITASVTVELLDETRLSGEVQYLGAGANRRMQDHLNQRDRFLTLRRGDSALFVSKRHVARIAPER